MNEASFLKLLYQQNSNRLVRFPDKTQAENFINELFRFLFVPQAHKFVSNEAMQLQYLTLKQTFTQIIAAILTTEKEVKEQTTQFFDALPSVHEALLLDADAVLQFDPAATSLDEVLIAYPGFYATAVYRISHQLRNQGLPLLPRIFSEHAHSKTGIDINPGAVIGPSFFIDHGTGIVIGETSHIGSRVKIYQGVTLGAMNVSKELASTKRHPTIEDDVVIYSGATILGGETVVGKSSIIGGNVWLTYSVPPHSIVYHKSEMRVRDKNPLPEGLNFVI